VGLLDGIYNSAVQDATSVKNIDLIIDSENERQHSLRASPTSRNIFGQEVPPFTGNDILSLVMGVSGGPVNMAKVIKTLSKMGKLGQNVSKHEKGNLKKMYRDIEKDWAAGQLAKKDLNWMEKIDYYRSWSSPKDINPVTGKLHRNVGADFYKRPTKVGLIENPNRKLWFK
tara:strand:- start:68 stop:580 length:513 start_codon:yes stop_codon:yes gene_type:complete